jgi:hypothetical protein
MNRQIRDVERKRKSWETPVVNSNEPLLINHCSTNAYLVAFEKTKSKYMIDEGAQVFAGKEIDSRKYDDYKWRIVPLDIDVSL